MSTRITVAVSLLILVLLPVSAFGGEAFRFSVMGDNRPPGGSEDVVTQPEEFRQAIREVNLLRPDLSLILGDLIMGYTADEALIAKEWAAFDDALKAFRVPTVLVAGNHDVWDVRSEAIFVGRAGYLHKSFEHKGCRFIVLNSEDLAHREKIAGEQLDWLKAELVKPGARRTFLFLHKPFWRYEDAVSNWNTEVHPLLVKAGVEAVFAGHWHNYERSTARDGVRYYITGGAGAEIGENPKDGDFFHHLIVDVPADDKVPAEVHVLRTGFLVKDDIVTEEFRLKIQALTMSLLPDGLTVEEGEDADLMIPLKVRNPWPEPITVRHEMKAGEAGGWKMDPPVSEALIPGNGEREIWLRFRAGAGSFFPAPEVELTGTREGEVVLRRRTALAIRFARRIEARALTGPVTIDGKLDEAAWAKTAMGGGFLRLDGQDFATHGTEVRMARDDKALYLAFRCAHAGADETEPKFTERDWMMVQDDSVVFYLDPVRDGKTRYCFGATAHGVRMEYRAPGGAVEVAWNPDWELGVTRDAEGWTLEVRIPYALIGMKPEKGAALGVNAIRMCTLEGGELSGWSIPSGGRLSNPKGFGEAVLK